MRNRLFLFAATILFVACADDQHSTAPASRTTSGRSASANVTPSTQTAGQAKPIDQVGFTKIAEAVSKNMVIPIGGQDDRVATCPLGSVAVSGGVLFLGYVAAASPPWITFSGLRDVGGGQSGWAVTIDNEQPGANGVTVRVFAYCAS